MGYLRGKNFLGVGGVAMGIIGSDLRRNVMLHTFGMGSCSFDMSGLDTRINEKFYDNEELKKACDWFKKTFKIVYGNKNNGKLPRPLSEDELVRQCLRETLLVRDLMQGNAKLALRGPSWLKGQGYRHVEWAQGYNAIAAGTQGQRQWTDAIRTSTSPSPSSTRWWTGTASARPTLSPPRMTARTALAWPSAICSPAA